MPGNSFANWGKITPRQNAFVNKILQSDAHVIATMRVKQDYVLNQKNGKMVPEKVGLKAIQRNDVDFEFTIVFDIDITHAAKATKDRTGLFVNMPEFVISPNTGKKIKEWCSQLQGRSMQRIKNEIGKCESIEALRYVYSKYPELQDEIKPLILEKKQQLEEIYSNIIPPSEINNQNKHHQNGIDTNK
jgi:hypothetical protein